MSVANLENSKKLYELSGWGTTYLVHNFQHPDEWQIQRLEEALKGWNVPAYDAGYLLRKLSEATNLYNLQLYYSVVGKCWKCLFVHFGSPKIADTPEDALCLLAIELFNQGVLKREEL